jgi:hypothetical protein
MKKITLLFLCIVFSFLCVSAAQKPTKKRPLQWSKNFRSYTTWISANEYCANLDEDGHKDWRLPTIDELRSVVEQCPETATGGKCAISEKNGKLRMEDFNKRDCSGCRKGHVNIPGKGWVWSSSQRPGSDHYWLLSFKTTRISEAKMTVPYNVYCVR